METTINSSIVECFVSALGDELGSQNTLAIAMSNFSVLKLESAHKQVGGFGWMDSVPAGALYDYVVADLPLNMGRERLKIGNREIIVRKNWGELAKALRLLNNDGFCLALVEPPGFGMAEGLRFEEALNSEGYHLCGIINTPNGLLESTSIKPVLVVISRSKKKQIFVAELEGEQQAASLAHSLMTDIGSNSLSEGVLIAPGRFIGFTSLKAEQQLSWLETHYKEYDSVRLGDIANEINTVRSGECHKAKENAIYIPMIGSSSVSHDMSHISIKHHNLLQVVLSEKANNEYLSAFFQSELGKLVLNSLVCGAVIPKIRKSVLSDAKVALPAIEEQREIAFTHKRLSDLKCAISDFQSELALNPRSAAAIKLQLESMLEQIGGLSDADKIMSLVRAGESKTIEYKETFSLDLRTGSKEKYIEQSALKTIVAFLNTDGGTLLIGISDTGATTGIRQEVYKFHKSSDAFLLHFKNQIKQRIGEQFYPFINHKLVNVYGVDVLMIECGKALSPCFLDSNEFYVRTNPATDKLDGPKLVEYVRNHFKI